MVCALYYLEKDNGFFMGVFLHVKQDDFSGGTFLPCVGLSRECSQSGIPTH